MSARSLGAPRTTTPLTIDLTETIVSDAHSAPDLSYPQEPYDEMEPRMDARSMTNPHHSDAMTSPSSTPVTPVHENSRIAIHKGQSNSSITYEYTANEDNSSQDAVSRDVDDVRVGMNALGINGGHTYEDSAGLTSASEAEQPPMNGMGRQDGLSMHCTTTTTTITNSSNSSVPSNNLHVDVALRQPLYSQLGPRRVPPISEISISSSNRTSTSSDRSNDRDTTEERLAVLESLEVSDSSCSDFEEEVVTPTRCIAPPVESPQRSNSSEDVAHVRALSSSSEESEVKPSQSSCSSTTSGSADLDLIQAQAEKVPLHRTRSIDEALKLAHELSSPTDDQYTVSSFETRSLESFAPDQGDNQFMFSKIAGLPDVALQGEEHPFLFTGKHSLTFSEDEEIGENLGITNQKLQVLEDNLDETSANLQQLELSLAETRESLKEMETDVLSSDSEEEDARVERVLRQAREVQERLLQPLSTYDIKSIPLDIKDSDASSVATSENVSFGMQARHLETVQEVDVTPETESRTELTSSISVQDANSNNLVSGPDQSSPPTPSSGNSNFSTKPKLVPNLPAIGNIAIIPQDNEKPLSPPSKSGQFVSEIRLQIVRSPPPTPKDDERLEDECKRDSKHSIGSDDSARQTFADRSVEDILTSREISFANQDNDSVKVHCNMSVSDRSDSSSDLSDSDSSTSSNDSCIYQYKVAEAKFTKSHGGTGLSSSSSDEGEQEVLFNDIRHPVTNGLLARHALGNGGIIREIPENGELFDDLQSGGELLDGEGESVANSDDFD